MSTGSIYVLEDIYSSFSKEDVNQLTQLKESVLEKLEHQNQLIDVVGERELTDILNELIAKFYVASNKETATNQIAPILSVVNDLIELNLDNLELLTEHHIRSLSQLFNLYFMTLLIFVGILFSSSKYVLKKIYLPLKMLNENISRFFEGEEMKSLMPSRIKEISDLNKKFNKLLDDVERSKHSSKVKILRGEEIIKEIIDIQPHPIAVFLPGNKLYHSNPKFVNYFERLNSQLLTLEKQGEFSNALDNVLQSEGEKAVLAQFNEQFANILNGYKCSLKRIQDSHQVLTYLILIFKKSKTGLVDFEESYIAIQDALISINSVQMALHALAEGILGDLKPKQHEFISIARNDCIRSKRVLENTLTRERSDDFAPFEEVIDISHSLNKIIKDFYIPAKSKNLEVIFDGPPMPAMCKNESNKLEVVFTNLVDNAINNSPKFAAIKISVEQKEGIIHIAFANSGSYIPKEFHESIFEKHFKIPGDDSKREGLGLFLAKKIIQGHGGRIWVESEKDETTFYIELKAAVKNV
jgi:signal transduction histidine kinase